MINRNYKSFDWLKDANGNMRMVRGKVMVAKSGGGAEMEVDNSPEAEDTTPVSKGFAPILYPDAVIPKADVKKGSPKVFRITAKKRDALTGVTPSHSKLEKKRAGLINRENCLAELCKLVTSLNGNAVFTKRPKMKELMGIDPTTSSAGSEISVMVARQGAAVQIISQNEMARAPWVKLLKAQSEELAIPANLLTKGFGVKELALYNSSKAGAKAAVAAFKSKSTKGFDKSDPGALGRAITERDDSIIASCVELPVLSVYWFDYSSIPISERMKYDYDGCDRKTSMAIKAKAVSDFQTFVVTQYHGSVANDGVFSIKDVIDSFKKGV
jgi:hypothetical protein